MKRIREAELLLNIYELPELPMAEELVTTLAGNENVRIERIVSAGHTTGWYDQGESELVILLQGAAKLEYDDGRVLTLGKGDMLLIKPHERHRVCYTSTDPPCIWLCVFF